MKLSKEILNSSIKNSSNELLQLSKDIKNIVFPEPTIVEFETVKLNDKYIVEILNDIPAGYAKALKDTDFIYVFSLKNASAELQKDIFQGLCASRDIQDSKDFEGKKDFCRANHSQSECLYVGRSQKLKSRLKQHLDAGGEGIFAMHMLRWIAGISIKAEIHCYQFDGKSNLIIQALEDGLWDQFKPMFGRKGER